jgi:glyoxylase-like metal-dependent hydrolase (beta-lactamase superfamily II)
MSLHKHRGVKAATWEIRKASFRRRRSWIAASLFGGILVFGFGIFLRPAHAQQKSQDLDIIQLRANFYMIAGAGGNIALETGPDGSVLVDAGNAESADRVIAAIKKLTNYPVRYIINTGSEADHAGGNGKVSKAGQNMQAAGPEPLGGEIGREMTNGYAATIMSTDKLLLRMSAPTGKTAVFPNDDWPTETYFAKRKTLSLNDDGIEILNMPSRADGDSLVFFRRSDVVVAGDVIDATRFPRIDLENGGTIDGEIASLNRIIELTIVPSPFTFQPGGTLVVPGHGRVYDQIDALNYRDMVVTIRDIILDMIKSGKTLEQVKAAAPASPWAQQYGPKNSSYSADNFVEAIYKSLKNGK